MTEPRTEPRTAAAPAAAPLIAAPIVARWEKEVSEQVRRAVIDGVREIAKSRLDSPFGGDDYQGGIRTMMYLLIGRFSFTRKEAERIVEWYALDES